MEAAIEKNNRLIAMGITTLIAAVLLIVILLIKFVTPIPPFPESEQGGLEVNFGFDEAGMGDNNSMEQVNNEQQNKTEVAAQPETSTANEMVTSEEVSEVVAPPVKNKVEEVKIEEPKIDENLLKLQNKTYTKPGSSEGDGDSNVPGNQGDPNGTLGSNVYSTGGGKGLDPVYRLKGSGRKMIRDVAIYDNSQETGIVAVEILVDKYGKIIKAEPVLMGSTTTSSVLWKKAKDGLINQKLFNESGSGEEARGTIYINFTVR